MEYTAIQQSFLQSALNEKEEIAQAFENLPETKKKAILELPEQRQILWVKWFKQLIQLQKRKYDLEEALFYDKIPPEELSRANTNVNVLQTSISDLQKNELDIIRIDKETSDDKRIIEDRNARDGAVSLRPSPALKTGYIANNKA